MIYKLNPGDIENAIELMNDMSILDVADIFEVKADSLIRAIDQYNELGLEAFTARAIVDWKRTELHGKSLDECHQIIIGLGLKFDRHQIHMAMRDMKIKYVTNSPRMRPHEYKGVVGVKNIAKQFNKSEAILWYRLNHGMTISQAVETDYEPRRSYEYRGIKGIRHIADTLGISKFRLEKMVADGDTVERAVNYLLSMKEKEA